MRILVKKFNSSNQLGSSKKVILVALLLLLIPFKGLSQNESTIISKSEFETGIAQNRNVISKFSSYSKLINPLIIVENNQVKVSNDNPTCVYTDYTSVPAIDGLITSKKYIEYVSVRIKNPTDINSSISLTHFSDFKDLKYIHLIFEYEISNAEMEALIENPYIKCYIIYESREIM